jgi:hypothetical protein
MSLDITKIASQIGDMAARLQTSSLERRVHLKTALDKLNDNTIDLSALKRKIAAAHTPWAVARLEEALSTRRAAPSAPRDYSVLATDGSSINVDRNKAARCYLINIGQVGLRYGQFPDAWLESSPRLYSDEAELLIKDEKNQRREQPIEGALLDARRSVEECRALALLADAHPEDIPTLAMMDGSLVLYGLESFPDFVQSRLLGDGFLKSLDHLQELASQRAFSLASYISLPGSAEVVNVLRLALCPQEAADCNSSCASGESSCDVISGLNDRWLFSELLKPGERSALFINPSTVLKHYGAHQVYFFYLKLEEEIARIEIPKWIAQRPDLLDLTHTLVLDQCRKGQGYPVVLSEAHEQAVLTGADREEFWLDKKPQQEDALDLKRLGFWLVTASGMGSTSAVEAVK